MNSSTADVTAVLLTHGSPTPAANAQFLACVEAYSQTRTAVRVTHGFLEHGAPNIPTAIRAAANHGNGGTVIVVPLFLFQAGHVETDIAEAVQAVQRDFPDTRIRTTPALGGHPLLADIAHANVRALVASLALTAESAHAMLAESDIIFVGHGAANAAANQDFHRVAKFFAERGTYANVHPAFIGLSSPRYADTLTRLATTTKKRMIVVPYLLFDGYYLAKLHQDATAFSQQHPHLPVHIATTLGQDSHLQTIIDVRLRATLGDALQRNR